MGKITFILGGARSGKSAYALKLAKEKPAKKVAFVATCQPLDKEMDKRIKRHKKERPASWTTIEEPKKLASVLTPLNRRYNLVIIDCLTLLVSNLLLDNTSEEQIEKEIERILHILESVAYDTIIVSNEVGLGIVPNSILGRSFRDLAGRMNQLIAHKASTVIFMVAGIALPLKKESHG